MDIKSIANMLLEGADVRSTIAEAAGGSVGILFKDGTIREADTIYKKILSALPRLSNLKNKKWIGTGAGSTSVLSLTFNIPSDAKWADTMREEYRLALYREPVNYSSIKHEKPSEEKFNKYRAVYYITLDGTHDVMNDRGRRLKTVSTASASYEEFLDSLDDFMNRLYDTLEPIVSGEKKPPKESQYKSYSLIPQDDSSTGSGSRSREDLVQNFREQIMPKMVKKAIGNKPLYDFKYRGDACILGIIGKVTREDFEGAGVKVTRFSCKPPKYTPISYPVSNVEKLKNFGFAFAGDAKGKIPFSSDFNEVEIKMVYGDIQGDYNGNVLDTSYGAEYQELLRDTAGLSGEGISISPSLERGFSSWWKNAARRMEQNDTMFRDGYPNVSNTKVKVDGDTITFSCIVSNGKGLTARWSEGTFIKNYVDSSTYRSGKDYLEVAGADEESFVLKLLNVEPEDFLEWLNSN